MKVIAPSIEVLTKLHKLVIEYRGMCGTSGECLTVLIPALHQLTGLVCLCVESDSGALDPVDIEGIALALKGLKKLETLDIRDFGLEVNGALALAPVLSGMTTLRCLHLHSLGPYHEAEEKAGWGVSTILALAPTLQDLTCLTSLDLGGYFMGSEGMKTLAPYLQRLTKLEHLYLSCNLLGEDTATTALLLEVLKTLINIKYLKLVDHSIDPAFYVSLHAYLPQCEVVRAFL